MTTATAVVLSILILMGFGSVMVTLVLVFLIRGWVETKKMGVQRQVMPDHIASHQMFDRS